MMATNIWTIMVTIMVAMAYVRYRTTSTFGALYAGRSRHQLGRILRRLGFELVHADKVWTCSDCRGPCPDRGTTCIASFSDWWTGPHNSVVEVRWQAEIDGGVEHLGPSGTLIRVWGLEPDTLDMDWPRDVDLPDWF